MDGLSGLSAVGWGHFKLGGGWRTALLAAGGYAAVICGAAFLTAYDRNMGLDRRALGGWAFVVLTLLQGLTLYAFGVQRITAAVRRDVASNMLESHRLMPIPAWQAALGYLVGPTIPVLLVAVVNVCLAGAFAAGAGRAATDVLPAHAVLAVSCLLLWPAVAAWSMAARFALPILSVAGVIMVSSQFALLAVLPGLSVLLSPMIGESFPPMGSGTVTLDGAHLVSAAAQILMGLVFFAAVMRRFERDDRPAFGVRLGLIFLALASGVSVIGSQYWQEFFPRGPMMRFEVSDQTVVPTLGAMLLLALLPVSAAARHAVAQRIAGVRAGWRGLVPAATAVAAMAIVALIPLGYWDRPWLHDNVFWWRALVTAGIAAAFLWESMYLYRIFYIARANALLLGFLWMLGIWLVPLLVDGIRHSMMDPGSDQPLGWISSVSPLGVLILAWEREQQFGATIPGLLAHGLLAVGMGFAYAAVARRKVGVVGMSK